MFCVNVMLTAHDEADVPEIRDNLAKAAAMSRKEHDCVRFEVYHSESDPKCFLLCERWESEQAWKDHRDREAVQTIYIPLVLPKVDRTPHISTIVE